MGPGGRRGIKSKNRSVNAAEAPYYGQISPRLSEPTLGAPWLPSLPKDTLRVSLVYGLVGLVDVLHGDGVGELVEHPLLEGLQPLVVVAAAHKLLVLQSPDHEGGGS